MRVFTYEVGMPSRTKQEFKDECDVNLIVDAFTRGAPLPVQIHQGQFVDVSELGDYKTAVDTLMAADDVFAKLPGAVKDAVGNSPAGFLDFVNDPENADEMVQLGLVAPPPKEAAETPADEPPEKPAEAVAGDPPAKEGT